MSKKKILLMGGTGFLGREIGMKLAEHDYEIHLLTRNYLKNYEKTAFPCRLFPWDGMTIPREAVNVDGIINLVGEPLMDRQWSRKRQRQLLESRVNSIRAIKTAIAEKSVRPSLIIQASAIGFYQDLGGKVDESHGQGEGFLAELCQSWEEEAAPLSDYCRLVTLRLGLVLGWSGGILRQIWDAYASGVGATIGGAWCNWLHVADLQELVISIIENDKYRGTYNTLAPKSVPFGEFHQALCQYSRSWESSQVPTLAVKAVLGRRSQALLDNTQVEPRRLVEEGFKFRFPEINSAVMRLMKERYCTRCHYHCSTQWLPVKVEKFWEYIRSSQAAEQLSHSLLRYRYKGETLDVGSQIEYMSPSYYLSWKSQVANLDLESGYTEVQVKGPYKFWFYRHFVREVAGGTLVESRIEYMFKMFPISHALLPVTKRLWDKVLVHRQEVLGAKWERGEG